MDKKTLPIVILLVIAVIAYWPALEYLGLVDKTEPTPTDTTTVSQPATTQQQPVTGATGTPAPVTTTPAATPPGATEVALAQEVDTLTADTIIVETNKYTVAMSSKGGGAVSLFLKDYTYRDGQPVQMIPEPMGAVPEMTFAGGTFSTSALHFAPSLQAGTYQVQSDQLVLEYVYTNPTGGQIVKTYTFHANEHHYDLNVQIIGREALGVDRQYSMVWNSPMGIAEPNPSTDYDAMEAAAMMGGSREKLDDFEDDPQGASYDWEKLDQYLTGSTTWAGVRNKYFAAVMMPQGRAAAGVFAKGSKKEITLLNGEDVDERKITVGLDMPFGPVSNLADSFKVYVGPLNYSMMSEYNVGLEDMLDIGTTPYVGWMIKPFAIAIIWLLPRMYDYIPNYGLVIILFALLVKIVTLPLSMKSFKSMQGMKALAPQLEQLKKKHKKDPQKLNQETMKLYKKHGVNPMSGCLPMLPQMPLFFALFSVFRATILLRDANFVWFIDDLSLGAQSFTDPYMILVVLMVAAQFVSQSVTMPSTGQNKMMLYMMPLFMGYIFHTFAAGLVLYWTCFSVFSLLDWVLFKRKNNNQHNVKTA